MIGALLSAGTSLLGGLLGNSSAKKQAKAQARAQEQEYKRQKEFAQTGIQWKVQDATKAGIHPLYALGANTVSYAPQSVGGGPADYMPEALASAGQNIGRAIDSGRSSNEKIQHRMNELAVQRAELENTKLASEIALIQQPGTPPTPVVENSVIPGQGNGVKTNPHEIVSTASPGITAGAPADTTLYQTSRGYAPSMSEVYAEGAGEGAVGQVMHAIRNYIPPFFGQYHKGLPEPKPGHMWIWNPIGFEYVQTPIPNRR